MGRTKRVFGLGSFCLSDEERKDVCKYLKAQLRGNIPQPIENLTLNKYFELVKEIELAFCDETGVSKRYGYEGRNINFRDMSAEDVARKTLDGRQMFHSDYDQPEGILADYDHDCPKAFKWWIFHYTHLGHPWETSVGNFNPCPLWKHGCNYQNANKDKENYEKLVSDKWIFYFSRCHRNTVYAMRAFIRLRKLGYPVLWDRGEYDLRELTKKYFVDLSSQPQWHDMDEEAYESVTRTYG